MALGAVASPSYLTTVFHPKRTLQDHRVHASHTTMDENDVSRWPALHQFMMCYFNQMHDLTYGTFERCLEEFMSREPEVLTALLLPEMERAVAAGYVLDILPYKSPQRLFWRGMGGMRLVPRHLESARRRS